LNVRDGNEGIIHNAIKETSTSAEVDIVAKAQAVSGGRLRPAGYGLKPKPLAQRVFCSSKLNGKELWQG